MLNMLEKTNSAYVYRLLIHKRMSTKIPGMLTALGGQLIIRMPQVIVHTFQLTIQLLT